MDRYKDFSSLPPDQEQTFVVYEKKSVTTGKLAMMIAVAVCAVFLVTTMAIVFSFEPPPNKMEHDDLGGLAPVRETKAPAAPPATPTGSGAQDSAGTAPADPGTVPDNPTPDQ